MPSGFACSEGQMAEGGNLKAGESHLGNMEDTSHQVPAGPSESRTPHSLRSTWAAVS